MASGKQGVRFHLWSVGIPIQEGSRFNFKYPPGEVLTPEHRCVEEFIATMLEAREGRGCYLNPQPFSVIKDLVVEFGARIWCRGERRHLLTIGAREAYKRELYWPEDKAKILQHFHDIHALGGKRSSSKPATPRKRKRDNHEGTFDDYAIGSRKSSSIEIEDEDDEHTSPQTNVEESDNINLYKAHLWMKDSKDTCTAQLVLGTLDTIPNFFNAIKDAFLYQDIEKRGVVTTKGDAIAITIMFWNLGPTEVKDVQSPFTLDVTMQPERLRSLRLHLGLGFRKYRHEKEQLLCIGTVLFENDLREEMAGK